MLNIRSKSGWRGVLDGAASIAIVIFCLAATWTMLARPQQNSANEAAIPAAPPRRPAPALPQDPLTIEGAATRGALSAKVAVIEYSDFQCPYCASFARDTLPSLYSKYVDTGKVLMAFRHLPLPSIHPFATSAAEAAVCAGVQGKFWPVHDGLFKNPKELNATRIDEILQAQGLELGALAACRNDLGRKRVLDDVMSARKLGINGTPTLLIGSLQADQTVRVKARLSGAASFDRLSREIEKILSAVQP